MSKINNNKEISNGCIISHGIKDLPDIDKPYEKCLKYGIDSLTDSELLAIILRSGTKDITCINLAQSLLAKHSTGKCGFEYLNSASISELQKYKGVGKVKAIQIKAIIEISKRIRNVSDDIIKIKSPKDVFNLLTVQMSYLEKEEIRVIILDVKNFVKSVVLLSKGGINSSSITMKEILSEPLKELASGIILVHNHPTGDVTPSKQDLLLTQKIADYARVFDIELKDHIIIGKQNYLSIREYNSNIFERGILL